MNNHYVINELINNIKSNQVIEKPLKNWFTYILFPISLYILFLALCVAMLQITGNSSSKLVLILALSVIFVIMINVFYYKILYLRAFRVDNYINGKQQVFKLLKDYYMQNNIDVNDENNLTFLINIDQFCLFNKRLMPIFKIILISVIINPFIFFIAIQEYTLLELYGIFNMLFSILFLYWLYVNNNIWQNIFELEKQIYLALYSFLGKHEQYSFVLDIAIKRRNFILDIVFTILTFGLYFLYWDYKIHITPDKTFPYIQVIEEDICKVLMNDSNQDMENDIEEEI